MPVRVQVKNFRGEIPLVLDHLLPIVNSASAIDCRLRTGDIEPLRGSPCEFTEFIADGGFDDAGYWTIVDNGSPTAQINAGFGVFNFASSARGIYDEITRPNIFTNGQIYTVQLDVFVGVTGFGNMGFRLYNGTQLVAEVTDQSPGGSPGSSIDIEFTADQDGDLRLTMYEEISPSDFGSLHFIDNLTVTACIRDSTYAVSRVRYSNVYITADPLTSTGSIQGTAAIT